MKFWGYLLFGISIIFYSVKELIYAASNGYYEVALFSAAFGIMGGIAIKKAFEMRKKASN